MTFTLECSFVVCFFFETIVSYMPCLAVRPYFEPILDCTVELNWSYTIEKRV